MSHFLRKFCLCGDAAFRFFYVKVSFLLQGLTIPCFVATCSKKVCAYSRKVIPSSRLMVFNCFFQFPVPQDHINIWGRLFEINDVKNVNITNPLLFFVGKM